MQKYDKVSYVTFLEILRRRPPYLFDKDYQGNIGLASISLVVVVMKIGEINAVFQSPGAHFAQLLSFHL